MFQARHRSGRGAECHLPLARAASFPRKRESSPHHDVDPRFRVGDKKSLSTLPVDRKPTSTRNDRVALGEPIPASDHSRASEAGWGYKKDVKIVGTNYPKSFRINTNSEKTNSK